LNTILTEISLPENRIGICALICPNRLHNRSISLSKDHNRSRFL